MIAFIGGAEVAVLATLILFPLGLACTAFWLWMIVHSIRNERLSRNSRLFWVIFVWFLPFFGSVFYFIFGRNGALGGQRNR